MDIGTYLNTECERQWLFFESYKHVVSGILFYLLPSRVDVGIELSLHPLFERRKLSLGPVY